VRDKETKIVKTFGENPSKKVLFHISHIEILSISYLRYSLRFVIPLIIINESF